MIFRIIHLIMFMNFLKTNVLRNFHTIKIVIELNSENNCSLYMVTAVILNLKTIHVSFVPWNAIVSRMSQEMLILPESLVSLSRYFETFFYTIFYYLYVCTDFVSRSLLYLHICSNLVGLR